MAREPVPLTKPGLRVGNGEHNLRFVRISEGEGRWDERLLRVLLQPRAVALSWLALPTHGRETQPHPSCTDTSIFKNRPSVLFFFFFFFFSCVSPN